MPPEGTKDTDSSNEDQRDEALSEDDLPQGEAASDPNLTPYIMADPADLEDLEGLPEGAVLVATREGSTHRGPLPSPETIAEYNAVIPDLGTRIVNAWENETKHRHSCDNRLVDAHVWDTKTGRWQAFIFAMSALIVATIAMFLQQPWVAAIIGGGTIAAVVAAFLRQKTQSAKTADSDDSDD